MRSGARTRLLLVVVALALVAAGCGGGGKSSDDSSDPLDRVSTDPGDRAVQITSAGKVHLFGTFAIPDAAKGASVPGALIIPSAGPGDRDGLIGVGGVPDPMAKDVAQTLSHSGVATYRYDRRGLGESKMDPDIRLSVDDLVADARAGVDLLAQRKETAGKPLSVVAYDSGGLIALRLAASDDRIKRIVLIGVPGRTLGDMQAAQLSAINGPASGDALRATVADLIATRTLPPPANLRTELRPLFPREEANFLADLYSMDPAVDAAKVKAKVLIVAPTDSAAYAPERLVAAVPNGAAQVATTVGGPTLSVEGAYVPVNPNDPAIHNNGMAGPVAASTRDTAALGKITGFLTAAQ